MANDMARVTVEALEPRRLMSAAAALATAADVAPDVTAPTIVRVRMVGSPLNVEAVQITFSEPLDPDRAGDGENYVIAGKQAKKPKDCCCGDGLDDLDPFGDDSCDVFGLHDTWNGRRVVDVESAAYDPATLTVTLTPKDPFNVVKRLKVIRVRSGANGVWDAAGNALDGDADGDPGGKALLRFRAKSGRKAKFIDADGDRVRLKLSGGQGRLVYLMQINPGLPDSDARRPGTAVQVWVGSEADPAASALTGTVEPTRLGGDGHAAIRELLGAGNARIDLLTDPAFTVLATVP